MNFFLMQIDGRTYDFKYHRQENADIIRAEMQREVLLLTATKIVGWLTIPGVKHVHPIIWLRARAAYR